jgi:hypothetical protein
MPRNLTSPMMTALSGGLIMPVVLVALTFKLKTEYVFSGVGSLVFQGQTFQGVGSLGKVGAVNEGIEVKADGTSVTLSGIDKDLLGECLTDVQLGAPAKIWFGLMANGALIDSPQLVFSGVVDKPAFQFSGETISITLSLATKLADMNIASNKRYTTADQHVLYPDDTAFGWVESLNDLALIWGP